MSVRHGSEQKTAPQRQLAAFDGDAVTDQDPESLARLHDDCLGEIYKWCPDQETKRSLRQASCMTHSSPAINSQLGTLRLGELEQQDDLLAAVLSFPKYATLQCLRLGWRRKFTKYFMPVLMSRVGQNVKI